jgi:hypothetical protein
VAPGAPGTSSSAPGAAAGGNGSDGTAQAAATPEQRAAARRERRRVREHRVRRVIRRLSGCLGALDDDTARYLSLRGGLDGPPLTRGEAAEEVGISSQEAARVERNGLRGLRSACGGSGRGTVSSPGAARTLADSGSMPALQPAVLLEHTGGGKPLAEPQKLRGRQEVQGEEQSSSNVQSGPDDMPTDSGTATRHPVAAATTTGSSGIWIGLGAAMALLAVMAILAMRGAIGRRAHPAGGAATAERRRLAPVAAPVTRERSAPPRAEPKAEEEVEGEPETTAATAEPEPAEPEAGEPEPAERPAAFTAVPPTSGNGRNHTRARRSAAIAASGAISFLARELLKRRGRGGRHWRR